MPTLWYRDPADGVLKPYLVGGMSESAADAKFVKKSGDTMTGNLIVPQGVSAGSIWEGATPGIQGDPVGSAGDSGAALLLGKTSGNAYLVAGKGAGIVGFRPGGQGTDASKDVTVNATGLSVPGTTTYVDKPPFARYTGATRSIPSTAWTQWTAVSITDQDNGTFSGGSNMTVPAPGYYVVTARMLTSVAGRIVLSIANSGDGSYGNQANYLFDAKAAAAADWVCGSRTIWIDSYIQFWAYVVPTTNGTLSAEVIRVGGT